MRSVTARENAKSNEDSVSARGLKTARNNAQSSRELRSGVVFQPHMVMTVPAGSEASRRLLTAEKP